MMVSEPFDFPNNLVDKIKKYPEVNLDKVIENSFQSRLEVLDNSPPREVFKQEIMQNFSGVIKGEVEDIVEVIV